MKERKNGGEEEKQYGMSVDTNSTVQSRCGVLITCAVDLIFPNTCQVAGHIQIRQRLLANGNYFATLVRISEADTAT